MNLSATLALARKYPRDHPGALPPVSQSLGQEWYTIVLADDEIGSDTGVPSCPVCNYLASVRNFKLSDAVAQLDPWLEAARDGFGGEGTDGGNIDELTPFPTLDEIDGLNATELTAVGILLPPFHAHCRCQIAIV